MTDELHHAPGALGNGFTLCGFAYEGNPGEGEQLPPIVVRPGGRVTCPQCKAVIDHCRREFTSTNVAAMYQRRPTGPRT